MLSIISNVFIIRISSILSSIQLTLLMFLLSWPLTTIETITAKDGKDNEDQGQSCWKSKNNGTSLGTRAKEFQAKVPEYMINIWEKKRNPFRIRFQGDNTKDIFLLISRTRKKCFQPNFAIFFALFLHQQWKRYRIQILAGNTEYFKRVKICRITFDILWMKSQFQPDFTDNFFTRVDNVIRQKFNPKSLWPPGVFLVTLVVTSPLDLVN